MTSSSQPSTPPGEPEVTIPTVPHDHPIPRSRQIAERVVIVGMLLTILAVAGLAVLGIEQIRSEVAAEFERQAEMRDASDAAESERQRRALCTVIGESFQPTDAIAELSRAFGCPVDAAGQPVPETAPPAAPARPGPARAPGSAQTPERQQPSSAGEEPDTQPRPPTPAEPPAPAGPPPPPPPDDPDDEPPGPLPPETCTVPVLGPTICS